MSLFHRLGISLVILGMVQGLVPSSLRPVRASLRVMQRLQVALASLEIADFPVGLVLNGLPVESESNQDQESDQESHDTENLAETLAWPDGLSERRSVQRTGFWSLSCSISPPNLASLRTLSALQRTRSLPILASSSSATTRLCRFIC
jgi:hypothetical protein